MSADVPSTQQPRPAGAAAPAAARPEMPLPNVPIIDRPGATVHGTPLARPALGVRKRLMVVDDEPPILKLAVRILAMENYDIRSALSGPEALALLDQPGAEPIDLLVTDLMMPEMSGRELAAEVRRRHPGVRVLYQTGFADSLFSGVQELEAGTAFLEKPFAVEGMLEAVRLLLFGHIADAKVEADRRDVASEWQDDRLRARVVRLLRRWHLA